MEKPSRPVRNRRHSRLVDWKTEKNIVLFDWSLNFCFSWNMKKEFWKVWSIIEFAWLWKNFVFAWKKHSQVKKYIFESTVSNLLTSSRCEHDCSNHKNVSWRHKLYGVFLNIFMRSIKCVVFLFFNRRTIVK